MPTVSKGGVVDWQGYYEVPLLWTNGNGTNAFNVVGASGTFSPSDFSSTGRGGANTGEQYTKLQYLFNMFEKFKLCKVIMKYHPRWTLLHPVNTGGTYTGGTQSSIFIESNPGTSPPSNADPPGNTSQNAKEIVMFWDDEDIIQRPNSLVEFFQVRMQDGAKIGLSTHGLDLEIDPHYLDTVSVDSVAVSQESSSNPIDSMTATVLPKKTEWFTTKVATNDGGPVVLNLSQQYNGFKFYAYDAYNTDVSTQAYTYGRLSFKYYFTFKDMDNRALVTFVTLSDPTDIEKEKKRKLDEYLHPFGELKPLEESIKYVTKLRKAYIDHPDVPQVAGSKSSLVLLPSQNTQSLPQSQVSRSPVGRPRAS